MPLPTLKITADHVKDGVYIGPDVSAFDGHIEIAADLGHISFVGIIVAKGRIFAASRQARASRQATASRQASLFPVNTYLRAYEFLLVL